MEATEVAVDGALEALAEIATASQERSGEGRTEEGERDGCICASDWVAAGSDDNVEASNVEDRGERADGEEERGGEADASADSAESAFIWEAISAAGSGTIPAPKALLAPPSASRPEAAALARGCRVLDPGATPALDPAPMPMPAPNPRPMLTLIPRPIPRLTSSSRLAVGGMRAAGFDGVALPRPGGGRTPPRSSEAGTAPPAAALDIALPAAPLGEAICARVTGSAHRNRDRRSLHAYALW